MPEPQDPPAWAVEETRSIVEAIKAILDTAVLTRAPIEGTIARALAAAHERGEKKGREEEHREYARWLRGRASREHLKPAAAAALDDVAVVAEANAERGEWSSAVPMSDAIAARRDENDDGQD